MTVVWGASPNRSSDRLYTNQKRRRTTLTALTEEQYHRLKEGDTVRIVNNGNRTVLAENVAWHHPILSAVLAASCGLVSFILLRCTRHVNAGVAHPIPQRFVGRTLGEWTAFGQQMKRG